MGIPLFGLPYKYDFIRKVDAQDCAGNIVPGSDAYLLYSRVCSRSTTMRLEDEVQIFGNASGKRWQVTTQFLEGLAESDFMRVPPGVFPNVRLSVAQDYRVTRIVHKYDHTGCPHHTQLIVELEDTDG